MGRVRYDRLVTFDVEQTCWDGPVPADERPEIIEIGVAELLLDGCPRLGRTWSSFVRPMSSTVSAYCTALTGIGVGDVRRAPPLGEVLRTMAKEFGGEGKTWVAWGRDDASLALDCAYAGVEKPAMGGFVDLGALWAMLSGSAKAPGLNQALLDLGLSFEGRQHRALDDAINTARVALELSAALRVRLSSKHPETV